MTGIEVRTCEGFEEYVGAIRAIGEYGAWSIDEDAARSFMRVLPLERMHAGFDGKRAVGGAGAFSFDFSIPGGTVACAGITVVGVYPTYRRQGVLTAMMRAQLDAAHERGDPIAALWASDERIYGRYGYGLASLAGRIDLLRSDSAFAQSHDAGVAVRYVEPAEIPALAGPIWDHVRGERPGMFARTSDWWESRVADDPEAWRPPGAGPKRFVVAEADGIVEGYAVYRHAPKSDDGEDVGRVRANEVMGTSLRATAALWRYLLDMEWVQGVVAFQLPLDHPLFFLLARPRRLRFRVGDGLWVRLVDVRAALSARAYGVEGSIVLDVTDDFCRWNKGRWKLEGGEAMKTRATADLACDIAALGSVYLGGFTFEQLVQGGRVDALEPGAAERADAMFATARAPWCPEIF
ncbi:MAG: GNAT family N-acetyltransferase [Gaiellaceae bacterium]